MSRFHSRRTAGRPGWPGSDQFRGLVHRHVAEGVGLLSGQVLERVGVLAGVGVGHHRRLIMTDGVGKGEGHDVVGNSDVGRVGAGSAVYAHREGAVRRRSGFQILAVVQRQHGSVHLGGLQLGLAGVHLVVWQGRPGGVGQGGCRLFVHVQVREMDGSAVRVEGVGIPRYAVVVVPVSGGDAVVEDQVRGARPAGVGCVPGVAGEFEGELRRAGGGIHRYVPIEGHLDLDGVAVAVVAVDCR